MCVIASVAVLAVLIIWLGPASGIAVGLGVCAAVIAMYVTFLGPRQRRWGASDEEVQRAMPGDDLLRAGAPGTTRAITIDATPGEVFPWLLQIGYGRGGWYSYDLDRQRRETKRRSDRSSAPGSRRRRPHPDVARFRAVGPRDRARSPHLERRQRRHLVSPRRANPRRPKPARQSMATGLAPERRHLHLDDDLRPGRVHHGAEDAPDHQNPGRGTAVGQ